MADRIARSLVAQDFENDGKNLHGTVLRFGEVYRVSDGGPVYNESYARSAVEKTIHERSVPLVYMHPFMPNSKSNPLPFGVVRFEADGDVLRFHARFSDTALARDMQTLLTDGAIGPDVSLGFRGLNHVQRDNVRVRTEIAIDELSLLPPGMAALGADAQITEVRNEIIVPTPHLDALRAQRRWL